MTGFENTDAPVDIDAAVEQHWETVAKPAFREHWEKIRDASWADFLTEIEADFYAQSKNDPDAVFDPSDTLVVDAYERFMEHAETRYPDHETECYEQFMETITASLVEGIETLARDHGGMNG